MDANETSTREDARRTTDPDDAQFVGVRPEVDRLLRAANQRVGDQITKEQYRAAELMAQLLDTAAVDQALDLVPGTVRSWMDDEAFFNTVVEERRRAVVYRTSDEDLGRILSAKQRAAARMLVLDIVSQTNVARDLRVSDRTIRNWGKNPAFRMYQDQLEHEEEARHRARRRMRSDQLSEAKEKALQLLLREVEEEGDLKAAVELLRLRE